MRFAQGKLREGSGSPDEEILRCAQDDSQDESIEPFSGGHHEEILRCAEA